MIQVAELQAEVSAEHRDFDRGMDHVDRRMDDTVRDTESKSSRFGGAWKVAGVAAAGGIGLAGFAVLKAGFGFNQMREQAEIAFTTMLGSGEKAKVFLDDLADFAKKTPFEFPELVATSQKLLAMGFSARDVVPTMTAIGDAVSALGGSPEVMQRVTTALGQIQAKGKASAEEMMQLTEAGIPAWQMLADKIGVSVPEAMELVSKGAVDAGTTIGAMTEGMNKRFGGMMEEQSKTFGGMWSTLKDNFTQISGSIMKPFFELATRGLTLINQLLSGEGPAGLRGALHSIRDALSSAFGFFGDFIDGLTSGANNVTETWKNVGDAIKGDTMGSFSQATMVAFSLGTAVVSSFKAIIGFIQNDFLPWWRANILPIWQELAEIVGEAIGEIMKVFEEHEPEIRRIVGRIGDGLALLATVMREVVLPIVRFLFVEVLPRAIVVAIKAIDEVSASIEGVIKFGQRVVSWFRGDFVGLWRSVWRGIGDIVFNAKNWILTTFLDFALRFVKTANTAFGWIPGVGDKIKGLKEKIEAMKQAAELAAARRYAIRFVTNAARVKSDIEDLRGSLPTSSGGGRGDWGLVNLGNVMGAIGGGTLVQIGRQLERMGFDVWQHPAFGGVSGGHRPGSYHYRGRAIDVNWPGGGSTETHMLRQILPWLARLNPIELLLEDVGRSNQHLHLAMARGGYIGEPVFGVGLRTGTSFSFGERGGEWVSPDRPGGVTLVLNRPMFLTSERETMRTLQGMLEPYAGQVQIGMAAHAA